MPPTTLEGWTLEEIRKLAHAGVTENDLFDLKGDLQPAEHERKIVAAFANSGGGFLVFGVTNDRCVKGVTNPELARDFGGKLRDGISPSVEFRFADRPITLSGERFVYVAHIPRSARGPHAVYINGSWTFWKRTAGGSNDPMTFEEIRAAFTDARRRERELAWLKADVERVRVLAEKMNSEPAREPNELGILLTRFNVGQLRTLVLSQFDEIGRDAVLVGRLNQLVEDCAKVDELLVPMAAFATRPRDQSYSGTRFDGLAFAKEKARQIIVAARHVLEGLEKLG